MFDGKPVVNAEPLDMRAPPPSFVAPGASPSDGADLLAQPPEVASADVPVDGAVQPQSHDLETVAVAEDQMTKSPENPVVAMDGDEVAQGSGAEFADKPGVPDDSGKREVENDNVAVRESVEQMLSRATTGGADPKLSVSAILRLAEEFHQVNSKLL